MPRNAATNRLAIRDYPASLSFNGTSSRVDANYISGLPTAGTVILRFKARSLGKQLINNSNGSSDRWCISIGSDGTLRAMYFTGAANAPRSTAIGSIQLNQWYQGGYSYNSSGTVGRIYLNGVVANSGTQQPGTTAGTTFNIGSRGGADFFDGLISEVLAWNRVLTDQEVSDLYFNGIIPTGSIAINLPLTEGAGTVANDISGNGNNGTITSGTFVYDSPMKARKLINANMVKNGDFEYAPPFTAVTTTSARFIDGTAAGSTTNNLFTWYLINGAGTFGASFDSTTKYAGSYSIKLEATDATGRGRVLSAPFESSTTAALVAQYGYPAQPSTDYDISAYIKTASASASSVRIQALFYTADGTQSGSANGTFQSATQDFTLSTLRFTTASTTRYIVIRLDDNTSPGAAHQCWFDNVSLTPVYPEGRVPANGNLVKNFDFEVAPTFVAATNTTQRFIDGTAAGSSTNGTYKWAIVAVSTAGTFSAQFDSSVSFAGQNSMKLSIGATGSALNVGSLTLVSAANLANFGIPVIPNTSYTATYRMRTVLTSGSATTGARMNFNEYDSAAGNSVSNQGTAVLTTTDWTLYTVTFTTAATTNYIVPRLVLRGNDGAATLIMDAWFDDIYLAPTTNPGRVAIT